MAQRGRPRKDSEQYKNSLEQEAIRSYIAYLVQAGLPDDMIQFFLQAQYVPNKSQIAFHLATLECGPGKVQEVLMSGPKGGGKSFCELMQAAFDCTKHEGLVCLFLRKQKGSASAHMAELATAFKHIPHTIDKNQITFPNGSVIKVAGYNTSGDVLKYNGQNLSLLIYDELTMIKQEDYDLMWGNLRLAKAGYYPKLNFSAGLGSNYYTTSAYDSDAFGKQLKNNFSQFIGLNLSIPIFSRFQVRNSVRSARADRLNQELKLENVKKTLYKEIQQVYYNALNAISKEESSREAVVSSEDAFNLMQAKYENGKANMTEFNESKNNYLKSESDLVQARYELLYQQALIQFYRGHDLQFN